MLWTSDQIKRYDKYLKCEDEEKDIFFAIDPTNIPQKEKELLLDDDEWFFYSNGYHMIRNYEELKN